MYFLDFYKIGKSLEQYFEHNEQIIIIIINYIQIYQNETIIYDKEHFDNDHICTCKPSDSEFSPDSTLSNKTNNYEVGTLLNVYVCNDISNIILDFYNYKCYTLECWLDNGMGLGFFIFSVIKI